MQFNPFKARFVVMAMRGVGVAALYLSTAGTGSAGADVKPAILNEPLDISPDFKNPVNQYYIPMKTAAFDPATGRGKIKWQRSEAGISHSFNNEGVSLKKAPGNEFPSGIYSTEPELPFSVDFVGPNAIRVKIATSVVNPPEKPSLMIDGELPVDKSWTHEAIENGHRFTGVAGSITIVDAPWRIELRGPGGKLLTRTLRSEDPASYTYGLPFSYMRRVSDFSRSFAANFELAPGEKIFGCGETFGALDKRGQHIVLCTTDGMSSMEDRLYKPIPFMLSSRGYGLFMHTTAPITCDVGADYAQANQILIGDQDLDLFIFLGKPKKILDAYTGVTGKAPMPPLWSFGLWMSRITYDNEKQVRGVAARLASEKIPADVIHLDTGWFENDWECDYRFSESRFDDPKGMIADLKKDGFHICLWQLPYFIPKNRLFPEIIAKGLYVKDARGGLPYDDAVLDFSNPDAVEWYQDNLKSLLRMGVGAIKADFGEAAPLYGLYASGTTGFYEHNLYPLRYNKTVAEITRKVTGENVIWARSAWAGSQRYPLHWGGDVETTDYGMLRTLRAGLSLGMSGFTFWSHDIGGFTRRTPEDLYRRWLPFGMLSSHTRCHGQPPKEPWEYGESFTEAFRKADDLRYSLMPYIYAQAKLSSEQGLPMMRALLLEFPDDPGAWTVEDAYMFGSDLLVAPMFNAGETSREVYLPGDAPWTDYQTGEQYEPGWRTIEQGKIPVVILARAGAAIPTIAPAQNTAALDWTKLTARVFPDKEGDALGTLLLPGARDVEGIEIVTVDGKPVFAGEAAGGKIEWTME